MALLEQWAEFFDELEHVRGRSKNTVMAYRRDLELYTQYKDEQPGGSIKTFYEYMKGKKLSARSQARVVSSLRTYFRFLETRGRKSPELRELKQPKIKANLPKAITMAEFDKLYAACVVEDPYKTNRNQMTLLLLMGLGCRVSELIDLNLRDYSETESRVKVTGKGGKERIIPLTESLSEALKVYLTEVRGQLVKGQQNSLLVNDRSRRPSRVDIWRWLAAWSAKAGFAEPVHPHRFRHGCATALLESGADLRSIQMLLGHSSIQTTQIYTSVTSGKMAQAIKEHHPLSQLDES